MCLLERVVGYFICSYQNVEMGNESLYFSIYLSIEKIKRSLPRLGKKRKRPLLHFPLGHNEI